MQMVNGKTYKYVNYMYSESWMYVTGVKNPVRARMYPTSVQVINTMT